MLSNSHVSFLFPPHISPQMLALQLLPPLGDTIFFVLFLLATCQQSLILCVFSESFGRINDPGCFASILHVVLAVPSSYKYEQSQ